MKTGTCYFPTYGAAMRYYRPYAVIEGAHKGLSGRISTQAVRSLINAKLNASEIHIGKPVLKPGDVLTIEDNRYFVTEATK